MDNDTTRTPDPTEKKEELHPNVKRLLGVHFYYKHLPPHLQAISKPCSELAHLMAELCPSNPDLTAGLRKLFEAKNAFVIALLPDPPEEEEEDECEHEFVAVGGQPGSFDVECSRCGATDINHD